MVKIGICGIGFMGMIHFLATQRTAGARVVAVCSRDPKKRAGDWTGIQGNFGPAGAQMDLSGIAAYAETSELFADPNVDLVDLCVPTEEHARLAIQALEAGKDVLVEKPIALTLRDAEAMCDAASASGRLLMVAHVLPFFPEFAFAREVVASGRYGALQAAHFLRVISQPDWSGALADLRRSGGPAIDLHIHDTHFLSLLCGVPRAVRSVGVVRDGVVVHASTQYLFDGPQPVVTSASGALSQSGRPFAHGYELYLERATLCFESMTLGGQAHLATPVSLLHDDGRIERPDLGSGDPIDAFAHELDAAAQAVGTRVEAPALSGTLARQALRICLAEIESVTSGQTVPIA